MRDRVRGDKAFSSSAIRRHPRRRGIVAVIPEPADQTGHHRQRGPRGIATRYDKLAIVYRAATDLHTVIT